MMSAEHAKIGPLWYWQSPKHVHMGKSLLDKDVPKIPQMYGNRSKDVPKMPQMYGNRSIQHVPDIGKWYCASVYLLHS